LPDGGFVTSKDVAAAVDGALSDSSTGDGATADLTDAVGDAATDAAADGKAGSADADVNGTACEEGAATCADLSTLVTCKDGALVATSCASGAACCGSACAPLVCTPYVTKKCLNGNTAALCDACGTGYVEQPCLPGYTCNPSSGVCGCKSPIQILFVLDASGSMELNQVDGKTRWQVAQEAIGELMSGFPNLQYGLMTFPDHPVECPTPGCASKGGCAADFIDELNAPTGTPSAVLTDYLAKRKLSTGNGKLDLVLTPLAGALDYLGKADLGAMKTQLDAPRYVILISDGEDTCVAPHAPALLPGLVGNATAKLRDQWNIQTFPVGFGYAGGSQQLSAIAQRGGTGLAKPLLATDSKGLQQQLLQILTLIDPKKCTGSAGVAKTANCAGAGLQDVDQDGWCSDLDCKDADASVHPGAAEVKPGLDDDCDGYTDEAPGFVPPPPGKEGCKGIDFLFVIDNSGSMAEEQKALIQSFPGFLAAIQAAVPTGDYHVMVVDSDATGLTNSGSSSSSCTSNGKDKVCTCNPAPSCCEKLCNDVSWGPTTICNGAPACGQKPPPTLTACDNALGAGRTYSGSYDACFKSPPRHISSATADLAKAFSCAANVGIGGSGDEKVMEAMTAAISPALAGPGGCNDGFLRKDAILVVTFITDEADGGSAGTADSWYKALVDAKGGKAEGIYVLGVFGDNGKPGALCLGKAATAAPKLDEFLGKVGTQGQFCSICQGSYGKCFSDAVSGIKTTCDNYVTE
jgi:hypothetical protein